MINILWVTVFVIVLSTDCVGVQIAFFQSSQVFRYYRKWSERIERCERLLKGWLNNGKGGVERDGRRGGGRTLGGGRVSKLARLPSGRRCAKTLSLRVQVDCLLTFSMTQTINLFDRKRLVSNLSARNFISIFEGSFS